MQKFLVQRYYGQRAVFGVCVSAGIRFTHRSIAPIDTREIWHSRGARGPLGRANVHANRCTWVRTRPQNGKNIPLFGKESPRRGEPFDRLKRTSQARWPIEFHAAINSAKCAST